MSYKPDYGLRLKNNGISQEVESVTQNLPRPDLPGVISSRPCLPASLPPGPDNNSFRIVQ